VKKSAAEVFKYSSSIRFHSWVWTVEQLDRYLKNPSSVVRGTTMASRVRNGMDWADLIVFLTTLRSPEDAAKLRGNPIKQ
jgi:cytochrome c